MSNIVSLFVRWPLRTFSGLRHLSRWPLPRRKFLRHCYTTTDQWRKIDRSTPAS